MFRHGDISTETDGKPFVFTLIAFLGSLTAAILIVVLSGGQMLAVVAGFMLLVVSIAAGAVLFAMVSDQAFIRDDVLHMRYLFRRTEIPLSAIGRIECKDQVYSVYDRKGALSGTINARLTGMDKVLHYLDKNGVPFA